MFKLPKLREVRFLDLPYITTPKFSGLSECRYLTISSSHYSPYHLTVESCLSLLRACPHLREVDIKMVQFHEEPDEEMLGAPINLPFLHALRVSYLRTSQALVGMSIPFAALQVPALRSLFCSYPVGLQDETPNYETVISGPILKMFDAAQFTLDTLTMSCISVNIVELLLPVMQSVKDLGLQLEHGAWQPDGTSLAYRQIISFLTAPNPEDLTSLPFPALSSLELGCDASIPYLEVLANIVDQRQASTLR